MNSSKYFLITIDVEDWFQVENFKPWVPFSTWDSRELRVERNVHRLLDLFDSIALPPESPNVTKAPNPINATNTNDAIDETNAANAINARIPRATFFILGWIAKRLPHIVRGIASRGHEVASHGCDHELPNNLNINKLKNDLHSSRKRLEDILGTQVKGYRAPSFAINDHILKIIEECGYLYDSSYNSFGLHQRYGKISLNGNQKYRMGYKLSKNFYELPISNIDLKIPLGSKFRHPNLFNTRDWNFVLPFGGGGYFRLLPYLISRLAIRYKFKDEAALVFYMHPWEIDPEQPKVTAAPLKYRFRHYTNLKSTYKKLRRMITDFRSSHFITCAQFIGEVASRRHEVSIEEVN